MKRVISSTLALLLAANTVIGDYEISDEQHDFVVNVEGTLREFCTQLSDTYTKRSWNKGCKAPLSGCDFTKSGTQNCQPGFLPTVECGCTQVTPYSAGQMSVDVEHSVMMLSSHANLSDRYHEALCRQDGIDEHFVKSYNNISFTSENSNDAGSGGNESSRNPALTFYAGFPSGISRIYPGYSWRLSRSDNKSVCFDENPEDECMSYDARTQAWYSTASKGPLDVIFIIEKSKFQGPEKLKAAKSIMDTVGSLVASGIDYYRVIAFDEENVTADSVLSDNDKMILNVAEDGAVEKAVRALEVTVEEPDEEKVVENFAESVELAVEIMTHSRSINVTSRCRQSIVIIASVSETERVYAALNENYEKDSAPKIFVYTLADSEQVKTEHKKLTCDYNGLWQDVSDVTDTYEYVNAGLKFAELFSSAILTSHVIWSVDTDPTGMGQVVIASRACRWISTVPPKLIAVAGIEFRIEGNEDIFTMEFLRNVTSDNNECPAFELNKFEVENLRDERCENGADIAMIAVTVPISVVLVALTIIGLILSRDSNKFIFNWEKINRKTMEKYRKN